MQLNFSRKYNAPASFHSNHPSTMTTDQYGAYTTRGGNRKSWFVRKFMAFLTCTRTTVARPGDDY